MFETPCTIVRRSASGAKDELGNELDSETLTTTICSLQQVRADEPADQGEVSVTVWDLFLPVDTDLDTGDGVIVSNSKYEVVGDPWNANEGSAYLHHVAARVQRIGGAEDAS